MTTSPLRCNIACGTSLDSPGGVGLYRVDLVDAIGRTVASGTLTMATP